MCTKIILHVTSMISFVGMLCVHRAMGASFPGFSLADCQIIEGSQPMRNQDLISQKAPIVRFIGLTFHTSYGNL